MAEHPLGPPGPCIADLFRQLPAILALCATQQGFKIQPRLPPRLRANKQTPKPLLQDIEVITPTQHTVCDHQSIPLSKPSNMRHRWGAGWENSTVVNVPLLPIS